MRLALVSSHAPRVTRQSVIRALYACLVERQLAIEQMGTTCPAVYHAQQEADLDTLIALLKEASCIRRSRLN